MRTGLDCGVNLMKEIDKRLKELGLSWHWDEYRECLDLIFNFGEKNKIDPTSGQVGCISKWSEEDDVKEWNVCVWNNCYDDGKKISFDNFGYYESYEESLELAKFKAELVMMGWLNVVK